MIEEANSVMDQEEQRIVDLVRALCDAERELQELTGGQLDGVAGDGGKTYLLSDAQERLRTSEEAQRRAAETQTAILDALPANIALIDSQGVIVEVNKSWRQFASANVLQGTDFWVGRNYVEVCERGGGETSHEAHSRRPASGACWPGPPGISASITVPLAHATPLVSPHGHTGAEGCAGGGGGDAYRYHRAAPGGRGDAIDDGGVQDAGGSDAADRLDDAPGWLECLFQPALDGLHRAYP